MGNRSLVEQLVGEWSGPVTSVFGSHIVRLGARWDAANSSGWNALTCCTRAARRFP